MLAFLSTVIAVAIEPDPQSTLYFGRGGTVFLGGIMSAGFAAALGFGVFLPSLWLGARHASFKSYGIMARLITPSVVLFVAFASDVAMQPLYWLTSQYRLQSGLWPAGYVLAVSALLASLYFLGLTRWRSNRGAPWEQIVPLAGTVSST